MSTVCPHCLASFEIDANAPTASLLPWHCPHCGHEFESAAPGSDHDDDPAPTQPPPLELTQTDPIAEAFSESPLPGTSPEDEPVLATPDFPETATEPDAIEPAAVMYIPSAAQTPSFARTTEPAAVPTQTSRRWLRPALVVGLGLLLAGQCVVSEHVRLAADAQWRPWLLRACTVLGCQLPDWHDPAALRILTRDVRPHPSVPDALLISASFRNEAPWPQRWPPLELTLADLDGQAIGQRRFSAAQYLGLGVTDDLIQPGQTASITLEVRDPGKQAVAFEFDLL